MLNGFPRILIIRFSAIGDVVRTLPALHALRDAFPHAQIDWAVEKKALDIVAGHPAVDQVHVFERPEGLLNGIREFRQFCRTLRENRYDVAIDFHGIFKSGWASRATRAKDRYGFAPPRAKECSHIFSNHRVRLSSPLLNRVEENLALSEAAGAPGSSVDVMIAIPEEVEDTIDAYIQNEFQSAKRIVAVHAPVDRPERSGPSAVTRNW